MPGFLLCLNKTKYKWAMPVYRIYLKYNVKNKDSLKLLYMLDASIKERHIQNCTKRLRWNFCENVQYYEYTMESEYALW